MLPRLLQSASEISTHFRCDSCGVQLDKVRWKQCKICKEFDLCDVCAPIEVDHFPPTIRARHERLHKNTPVNNDCMTVVSVVEAENTGKEGRDQRRQIEYERILSEKKIQNDYDMAVVMDKLKKTQFESLVPSEDSPMHSIIVGYQLKASQRNIHVLSLDGGGVRGYMPIKILSELITQKYLPDIRNLDPKDQTHKQLFHDAQLEFTKQFDYFVGTSTGGLISFCLAINYNILDMMEIYSDAHHYFKKNRLGPIIYSKYDPVHIHKKIDDIINQIKLPDGTQLSAEHATLLDIRNLLNPDHIIDEEKAKEAMITHGNFLEFVDDDNFRELEYINEASDLHRVKREKILLITAYNTTHNIITIFNTSYAKHWGYRIADVLKATMAAPTYFPPKEIRKGTQRNGVFQEVDKPELFIDGGVFANDPELAALWAIRMQWKKPGNYHLLSIGTGCYPSQLSPSTWGGYLGWIFNGGIVVNTLMDATRSFTEIVGGNLAKFNNMRRMKLNYKLAESMDLDDPKFVNTFKDEWEHLKNEDDYKAFVYFYDTYIRENNYSQNY